MPTTGDDDHSGHTATNILIPVSSDKVPLLWDGNDATILGLLYETGRYYRKTGLFQTLVEDRAVALSNGRLAVDDPNTVYFVSGTISDSRSFDDPCPPTVDRLKEYNDAVAYGTIVGTVRTPLTAVPAEHKDSIILAKHCVKKEDSTFLHSLSFVFGDSESSDQLLEDADGSGLALVELLRARGKAASPRDKALVTSKFSSLVRDGVKGELTLSSFNSFLKSYKAARRNIAPSSRPSDEAEVEMISLIAIKDSASRELYELKTATSPPANLDQASEVLSSMLRGRLRCEEIDQIESGTKDLSLVAKLDGSRKQRAPRAPPALLAALASLGVDVSTAKPEAMAALVSALAPRDPRKTDAGKDKVKVPRDADGKPLRWVEGMATCRCGVDGGKHLFKDCPEKAKGKGEKGKALAAEREAPSHDASLTEDQLRAALASFFSSSAPVEPLVGHGNETAGESAGRK